MKSTQAWRWLTAGVLALGLNGIYLDGGAAWAHRNMEQIQARIADPSKAVIALASGHADWFTPKSGVVAAREKVALCHFDCAITRFRNRVERTETARLEISARAEAAMARMAANRARIEERADHLRVATFNPLMCPRVRVRVPRVDVSAPGVHIETVSDESE